MKPLSPFVTTHHPLSGRVLWRSFASEPHRPALKHLRATKVDDGSRDRTGMYWGVWVAEKKSCGNAPENTSDGLFWTEQKPMGLVGGRGFSD